jgi:hypothetical protein
VKKILGDGLSFFGNGDDTLLPAGASLIGFAAKPSDQLFAPSFLDPANNVVQTGSLTGNPGPTAQNFAFIGSDLSPQRAGHSVDPSLISATASQAGSGAGSSSSLSSVMAETPLRTLDMASLDSQIIGPQGISPAPAGPASANMARVTDAMTTGAFSKLDSQLSALHFSHSSMAADAVAFTSMVQQFAGSISGNGQYVVIDATAADGNGSNLLNALQDIGLIGGSSFGAMASGWLPIDQIETLAGLSDLNFARESIMTANVGSVTTQADHALVTDTARSTYGVTGAGVKVGIISDSFNSLGGYNANIASGDLPAGVQILQDSGFTDEGRGMAQLVYDIAPGASLAFATANGGQANFANNIIALKNAGAKVIVDDVSYFAEPMFQDGVIAQAVDQVAAAGSVYFSAAANNGHKGYEAGFLSSGTTQTIGGRPETLHNYNSASPTTFMQFTLAGNRTATVVLEWNQPAASVSPGHGATSDLDLFIYNASGGLVSLSQASNIGRDPIEVAQFSNFSSATQTYQIAVGLTSGAAPSDFKIVTFNGNGTVSNGFASNTNDGTVYGHAAATNAIAVGAAAYSQTPGFGVNPAVIESFSSAGPTRIFFDTAGNPISVVRQTPQITAPDGGNTSFFGADDGDADSFPNFYGTSAAAPAAAAVAALLLQANGSLTPAAIKTVLMNSAIDMDNPATPGFDTGFDAGTGAGLIQANAALAMAVTSVAINDVSIIEGNSGTRIETFAVTRSGGSAAFDVNFTTADGSATVADHDYVANSGTLHFGAGVNTQTISVIINGDAKAESNEAFFVNLSGATNGARISDNLGIGTIVDDDGNHVRDFNADGSSDILWQRADGQPAEWLMNGLNNTGGGLIGFNPGPSMHAIASGDFNGDGHADILWQGNDGTPAIWLMNGTNMIGGGLIGTNPGPSMHAIATGDFNGDGNADILWQGNDGTPAIWLMNGTNMIGGGLIGINPGPSMHAIATGDFNGDGNADILWQGNDGTPAMWLMNGTNMIGGGLIGINPGPAMHAIATGDFNGDGNADILWQGNDGTPAMWLMNGLNMVGGGLIGFNPGPAMHAVATGDFNNDHHSDILWHGDDGTPAMWLMNGMSIVSQGVLAFNPGADWHIIG